MARLLESSDSSPIHPNTLKGKSRKCVRTGFPDRHEGQTLKPRPHASCISRRLELDIQPQNALFTYSSSCLFLSSLSSSIVAYLGYDRNLSYQQARFKQLGVKTLVERPGRLGGQLSIDIP